MHIYNTWCDVVLLDVLNNVDVDPSFTVTATTAYQLCTYTYHNKTCQISASVVVSFV
jgi:hypothetical protein